MRVARLILAAAAVAIPLICAPVRAEQAPTRLKLIFPTAPTTYALPHFVAQDQGWLKDAGLDVEEIWLNGDANAMRALLSGQGDIAAPSNFPVYSVIAEGGKVKAVASWQPIVDYVLAARDGISSLADLAGGRIATASLGGSSSELPRMVMQKHGVDASKVNFISVGGHEARLQAVLAGKADAALVGALFAAQGKRLGKLNVLADLAREFPGLGYTYLVVNEKDLAVPSKRRAFETYIRLAVIESSRFIMGNPEKSIEVMHKRTPDLDVALIREVIQKMNETKAWGINGGIELEVTRFTAPLALALKATTREVRPEEVIDSSIVDALVGEMGRK